MRVFVLLVVLLAALAFDAPPAMAQVCTSPKPVYVRSYVKRDGTLVRAHCRSAPKRGVGVTSTRTTSPRIYAPRYTSSPRSSTRKR